MHIYIVNFKWLLLLLLSLLPLNPSFPIVSSRFPCLSCCEPLSLVGIAGLSMTGCSLTGTVLLLSGYIIDEHDSPFSSNHQLPVVPQEGVGTPEPFPPPCWNVSRYSLVWVVIAALSSWVAWSCPEGLGVCFLSTSLYLLGLYSLCVCVHVQVRMYVRMCICTYVVYLVPLELYSLEFWMVILVLGTNQLVSFLRAMFLNSSHLSSPPHFKNCYMGWACMCVCTVCLLMLMEARTGHRRS